MGQFNYFIDDLQLLGTSLPKMALIISAGKGDEDGGLGTRDGGQIAEKFLVQGEREMLQNVHHHDHIDRFSKPLRQFVKVCQDVQCANLRIPSFAAVTSERDGAIANVACPNKALGGDARDLFRHQTSAAANFQNLAAFTHQRQDARNCLVYSEIAVLGIIDRALG